MEKNAKPLLLSSYSFFWDEPVKGIVKIINCYKK